MGSLVVVAGSAALVFSLPALVRGRIVALASERLGLLASIGEVSVGWSTVSLGQLRLVATEPNAVQLSAEELVIAASPWSLALDGASGIRAIDAEGIDLDVDIASEAFGHIVDKWRARRAGSGAGLQHARPDLHAGRVRLSLRRDKALLLSVEGLDARLGPSGAALSAAGLRFGDAQAPLSGEMQGIHVSADAEQKLNKLSVETASFELGETLAAPMPPSAAEEGADVKEAAPAPKTAVAPVHPLPSWQSIAEHLASGAELTLRDGVVRARSSHGDSPILRSVQARVQVQSADELALRLIGSAESKGHLDADLRVWPKALRADGTLSLSALPLTLLSPFLPSVPWYEPERTHIDAELSIKTESLDRVALSGRAVVRDAALYSPRLAPDEVHIEMASIEGQGYWLPLRRRLELERGRIGLGKASVQLAGAVEMASDHYAVDLAAELPRTGCTAAVHSIPEDLLGDLALAEWTGNISGHLLAKVDSRDLDKTVLKVDVTDKCDFVSVPAIADLRRFHEPFTHSVEEPDGTVFQMETGPGTDAWTPITAISPFLVYAILAHEDPQFFSHHGFSPAHIRDALVRNLRAGRYVLGASTISMQLVKNVFLRREKTLARKIQEVLLTWWIERVMPKRESLELYLNVIEYGPSVYGIRSAARHYFNRLPSELSPAESVFLSTILPAPKRFHGFFERGALSPAWLAQARAMMQRMKTRGFYTKDAADYGLQELEHFKFNPEGTPAPPRVIPGGTGPLPYLDGESPLPASATDGLAPAGDDAAVRGDGFD